MIPTLQGEHGAVLVIVDQPNTIGALPVAVARNCGADIAYLPGLAMCKAANLYPGEVKTDARDAFNIVAALERVFKRKVLTRGSVLDLLVRYRGPAGLRSAGKSGVKRWAKNHTRKDPSVLIGTIFDALAEQTVTVPGTEASESVVPRHVSRIKALKVERKEIEAEAAGLADQLLLLQVLASMPGVGVKTAAQILLAAGGFSAFRTPGHLAAYAGIAPVTRRSGTSIRGEFPSQAGNKRLKNALFHSAWVASCHDQLSKTYYDRKRAEGKRNNAAEMCLVRRRLDVLFAMVKHGALYERKTQVAAVTHVTVAGRGRPF